MTDRIKKALAVLLISTLLLFGVPLPSLAAETVIYQNDFESSANMTIGRYPTPAQWGNNNPVSNFTWGLSSSQRKSGTKSLWCAGNPSGRATYDNNMNAYARVYADLSSFSSAHVRFWYKVPSIAYGGSDLGVLRIANGDDNSTIYVAWATFYPPTPDWTLVDVSVPSQFLGPGKTNVRFEWAWISDQQDTGIGLYIDDVYIGGLTAPDTTPPTDPTNLSAVGGANQVTLSWTASYDASGVGGYEVERSPNGSTNWTKVGTAPASPTTYVDVVGEVNQGKTWYYRVRAFDVASPPNYSGYSNVASAYVPDTTAPSQPAGLAVVQSGTALQLTWNASSDNLGVTGYKVERSPDGSTNWTQIGTVTGNPPATAYTDSTVSPDVRYYYRVRAYDAAGNNSSYSNVASGVVDTIAPTTSISTAPLSPDGSNGWFKTAPTVTLTSNEPGTTYYQWDSTAGSWTTYSTSFTAPEGEHVLYYYSVDQAGNAESPPKSSSMKVDASPPASPSGLSAARSGSAINLSWSASTDNVGVAGYKVERSTSSGGPFDQIAVTSQASYADSIPSSEQNKTYYYRVKAYDIAGNESGHSNTASEFMPDVEPPSPPTSVSCSAQGPTSIRVSWSGASDNVGVSSYIVERATSSSGPFSGISEVTTSSYTDSNLKPNTTYYYRIWSKDAGGNASTSPSSVSSAKTKDSAINDANADALSDGIAFYDYGGATAGIWTFLSKGGSGFDVLPAWKSLPGYFDLSRAKVVTGDFNADGRADAMVLYKDGATASRLIYFESAGTGYRDPRTVFSSSYWSFDNTKLVSGDFDANGKDELMAFYTYGATATGVFVFSQNQDGTFSYPRQVFRSDYWDWTKTRLLSVKEEGRSKVVAAYDYGATATGIWSFELNPDGTLKYPVRNFYSEQWNFKNTSFLTGDVNADKRSDVIAFYNYGGTTTGAWVFYQNQGGTFSYPVRVFISPHWNYSSSTFIPGDFDGNGKFDAAAVYDYGGGQTGIWIFSSDGSSLSYPARVYLTPYWDNKRTIWVMPY